MIVITGPTASGKTARAVHLARAIGGEIVSADSRQVYRSMDIGTGKDLDEYGAIPYHMIDVAEAGEVFNLFRYLAGARAAIASIESRGRVPIVCGGSGMYVEALARGTALPPVPRNDGLRQRLDPLTLDELRTMLASMKTLHNTTDTDTRARAIRAIEIQTYYRDHPEADPGLAPPPPAPPLIIGVDIDRATRRERISRRLDQRLAAGMVGEVRALIDSGVDPDTLIGYGLEYRFITRHLLGELTAAEMHRQLETAIHQFAKRQMTWLRGMERRGLPISWIPATLGPDQFTDAIIALISPRQ